MGDMRDPEIKIEANKPFPPTDYFGHRDIFGVKILVIVLTISMPLIKGQKGIVYTPWYDRWFIIWAGLTVWHFKGRVINQQYLPLQEKKIIFGTAHEF